MPQQRKKYYADDQERQELIDQYSPYLSFDHVPASSAQGVIRALLEEIAKSNQALNIKAAEGHLMAELLYDNGVLEEAKRWSEDISTEFQTAEENAAAQQFYASLVFEARGTKRVMKVLQEYSNHSTDQMREESDRVLRTLETTPRNNRKKTDWLNAILPKLLLSLKSSHACSTRCPANSIWPPMKKEKSGKEVVNEDAIAKITGPEGGSGITPIRDEILAYFHGLTTRSIDRYLDGEKPKTVSRSPRPRS
jgi:CRISPR/Cas system CSM-associated protein Csm3 (group 7 of RAMP superfamily)